MDRVLVVKYGGNAMKNDVLKAAVMEDLLALHARGKKVVLVHGGGIDIAAALKIYNKESKFINGLRVTDDETITIIQQVLAGRVNKSLVALLQGKAVGLSGVDGGLFMCDKLRAEDKDINLGWVGDIQIVNTAMIEIVLNAGFIPVIATIGGDHNGNIYNINADTAASQIAIALGAEKLICMTDISGVLRDCADPNSLIPTLTLNEIARLTADGVISGGMIPKLAGCVDCLKNGVPTAAIIDGRVPHALFNEVLGTAQNGTRFSV